MRSYILFFTLFITSALQAQNTAQLLRTADSLLLDNQIQSALDIIDRAESMPSKSNDHTAFIIKKAEILTVGQQLQKAKESITTAYEKQPRGLLLAELQSTEGMLALYQGRNDLAEEILLKAVKSFEGENANASLAMAKALTTLGLVYYNSGKTTQAEEQLIAAQAIRVKLLPEKHELIAASYNDLGLVYSKTDPNKALSFYEKAMPVYESLHGNKHAKIAINYANTGVIYQNLESYGEAINNLEAAEKIWTELSAQPNPRKAFVLHHLGYTYQLMGNNNNAELYYQKALDEYRNCYGNKHPDISNELNALGNIEVVKKNYDLAIQFFHQALESNLKNFYSGDVNEIPVVQDFYNGNYLLYTLLFRAEAYEAKHFGKTLKFSDLQLALANLIVCDTLIDKLRQQSNNEADKIALGTVANDVYVAGVRIAVHMGEVAFKNKNSYRKKAFYFAEKSKSAVLLEAISDVSAKSFAGIPQNLLEEEKSIKSSIALCAQNSLKNLQ